VSDPTLSYVVGGASLAAIGVGVLFGLRAQDLDRKSRPSCPSDCFTRESAGLNDSARTSALVANISYGVGAVGLLTTAYLWFVTRSSSESASEPTSRFQVGASLMARQGRVSVSGSF
jgi:hypothetical protein